jgi:hypothetical protein
VVVNACEDYPIWIASSDNVPNVDRSHKLNPGEFVKYTIPDKLSAMRWWPKMWCDDDGQKCELGDSGQPGQTCASIGCSPPVDSKFEMTAGLKVSAGGDCHTDAGACDWWDSSMVDGYTLPFTVDISDDCKRDGYGGVDLDCRGLSLDDCPSSQDVGSGAIDLHLRHPTSGRLVGCYSPCAALTTSNWNNPLGKYSPADGPAQMYCCPTPPVSPQQCSSGPASTMEYTQLIHTKCPNVYSYAYDDGNGLYTCPAETIYTWTLHCPAASDLRRWNISSPVV